MKYGFEGACFMFSVLLFLLACGLLGTPAFYRPSDDMVQVSAVLGGIWLMMNFLRFWDRVREVRAWTRAPMWQIESGELGFEERGWRLLGLRVPRWLVGWLPARDKGIFLGRGFQWSPAHTQRLESFLDEQGEPLPIGRDMRGGYPALHGVGMLEERPMVIPFSELVGHVLIGGTTRSGKTRLLEVVESEAITGPGSVVIIDPKGDAELLTRAAVQAHRAGRPFAFFSPAFPAASQTFNPLSTCETTTELAARVQALMPGGGATSKDPFFVEYPLAIVEKVGAAQLAVGDDWSLENLYAVTTMVPPLEDLIARYVHQVVMGRGGRTPRLGRKDQRTGQTDGLMAEYEESGLRDQLADSLLEDWNRPREHFQKVTANLTPAFRGVVGDKMGRLLSTVPPDLTWQRVVDERMVVYFAMSSLMFGEVANRIGRVILQDLVGYLGRRYAYADPRKMSPITILIDEFSNVAYAGFIDALNKGGGAKAHFLLAMQSLADPEATMGKDGTQRVLDNLNTRIWFRLTDDKTAEIATKGLGVTNVVMPEVSEGLSYGGVGGMVGNVSARMGRTEKPLIRPEWVTGLGRGECFVRTKGENWKLRVPLLKGISERELREVAEAYHLTEVLAVLKEANKAQEAGGRPVGRQAVSDAAVRSLPFDDAVRATTARVGGEGETENGGGAPVGASREGGGGGWWRD